MDKAFWQSVVANDCTLPEGYTASGLLPDLLAFLASPDPELRDDIAYLVFAQWVVRDKHFNPQELRGLIATLLQNLNHGIVDNPEHSVLLRSFSALSLSIIAYHDVYTPFLETHEVANLLDKTLHYLNAETDLSAYVEDTGWHHATAHTADILKFLCRNPKTDEEQHQRVLQAIYERLTMPVNHIYTHDEDERLSLVIVDIMRRAILPVENWQTWLSGFAEWKQSGSHAEGFVVTIHAPTMNVKNFLRSVYFVVKAMSKDDAEDKASLKELALELLPLLDETLKSFNVAPRYVQG